MSTILMWASLSMKLFANFFFLNSLNGMYFYGLEYIEKLDCVIVARSGSRVEKACKAAGYKVVSKRSLLGLIWFFMFSRKRYIFTPTPHPIPFLRNQTVTIHDLFPFQGSFKGLLKTKLFRMSLSTNDARIFHINRSDLPSIRAFLMTERELVFAPNRFLAPDRAWMQKDLNDTITIGLFGTDSPKKNYGKLFSKVNEKAFDKKIIFLIYGTLNTYIDGVINEFSNLDIRIKPQAELTLEEFICSCDLICSVSEGEGFARPIALSVSMGAPVLVVWSEVMEEFYDQVSDFSNSAEEIANKLALIARGHSSVSLQNFDVFQRRVRKLNESYEKAKEKLVI